jgi:nitrate reductase NapE component
MVSAHAVYPRVAVSRADVAQATAVFGYAAVLLVLIFGPPLLSGEFGPYTLIRNGDVLDLVSPIVALPVAWLLLREASGSRTLGWSAVAFMALGAMWFQGQGMHLAANAIGHLVDESQAGSLATLVHDLDEVLSHYVWHAALICLSLLVVVEACRLAPVPSPVSRSALAFTGGAALLYGFTYFVMVVEGATGLLGVPAAVLVAGGGLLGTGRSILRRPIVAAFVGAYGLSLLLFFVWAALHHWQLIEFSALGWI